MLRNRKVILIFILVLIFLFWLILSKDNFFHWDEWYFLTRFNEPLSSFLTKPYGEHYLPFNLINHYFLFKLFGLSNLPFEISVILFHVFSCFLLYKIIIKLTKRFVLAIGAIFLFGISNVYNEDLVWSQGISSVGSAALVFLAYFFYLKFEESNNFVWIFLSFLSLLMSPLFNAFGILAPFAFVFLLLLKAGKERVRWKILITYLTAGVTNLIVLWHFSGGSISHSTKVYSWDYLYKIPEFIIFGVVRGVVLRFLYPGLHLTQEWQNVKEVSLLILLIISSVSLILILKNWLKNTKTRWKRIYLFLSLLGFIMIGYLAAALGRTSYGLAQAGIARYTYQSFFFLIILGAIVANDFWGKIKLVSGLTVLFWVFNLYALITFENSHWKPIVNRDRQFISDVRYLFAHNQTIYDLKIAGIYPSVSLSEYWFAYPENRTLTFIKIPENNEIKDSFSTDKRTQEIYQKLLGDYQKKLD